MALVDYEKKDRIAIITLNRPERLNAVNDELLAGVIDACRRFEDDKEARVAIITGVGKSFSAGADVRWMAERMFAGETGIPINPGDLQLTMRQMKKPAIAAVNGYAMGMGLSLVTSCDIRIAVASAVFALPEIHLGGPTGAEEFLAQNIPISAAVEIALIGDNMTAQRAYDIGLINEVVPDGELMPEAMRIAGRIARLSPRSVSLVKQRIQKAVEVYEDILRLSQKMKEALEKMGDFKFEDRQEGIRAFVEGREPVWE